MKYTILDFNKQFPDEVACLDEMFNRRYSSLKVCPKCNKDTTFHRSKSRKVYACASCGHQLSPLADTIFHKSPTPLKLWFHAIFLFSTSKNGVSAKELQRQLGVTYKCAWRMAKQIRSLMEQDNETPLSGTVEVDETYVGGRRKGVTGRGAKGKTSIVGLVERGGDVKVFATNNVNSTTLTGLVYYNVDRSAKVMPDEFGGYNYVKLHNKHGTVAHGKKQYVRGNVHTNTIEGFWGQLKRSIRGTYVHVSKQHMQSYINEFAWRYNKRNSTNPLFLHLLAQI
jgi:transposase